MELKKLNLAQKLLVLLYADNRVIVSDDAIDFQNLLHSFDEYCTHLKLKVNVNKIKIIIFGARNVSRLRISLRESTIEIVKQYKYLGAVFSCNRSFINASKNKFEKAKKNKKKNKKL